MYVLIFLDSLELRYYSLSKIFNKNNSYTVYKKDTYIIYFDDDRMRWYARRPISYVICLQNRLRGIRRLVSGFRELFLDNDALQKFFKNIVIIFTVIDLLFFSFCIYSLTFWNFCNVCICLHL